MCGIFGIYCNDKSADISMQMVEKATNKMAHRGPDDVGFYFDKGIGLGHRRLSIIDLSHSGHQPMFNEDGHVVIVYNGEIYNFKEIQKDLIAKGHKFKSDCDTEVIIHAYEEWGEDCVQRFNGMFAFALWDSKKRKLWIVRDRLGIKPLYYYTDKLHFIFSSEIKPLMETGLISMALNEKVLDSYFSVGYVPAPDTMFKNIYKVMPGHYIMVKDDKITEKEYWDFAEVEQSDLNFESALEHLKNLFHDSVQKRLMSDVPLGVFLSGGLDSSAVVAEMGIIVNHPINTFTVGYDKNLGVSEENYAEMVASSFNTKHYVFKLEPEKFFSSIETMVDYSEEPIVESAAVALYHIAKLARNNAIVVLSGEGSDEILAGYPLYKFMNQINQIQKVLPARFWAFLKFLRILLPKTKYKKYFDWLTLTLEDRYQGTSGYLTEGLKKELYDNDFFKNKGDYLVSTFDRYFNKVRHKPDIINKMLYVDTKTWLVDDLLVKADKMTMAASVELRVPFLDYRIVEFATSLPSSFKYNKRNGGKHILKTMMSGSLPDEIIGRVKKGFPVPTKSWFGKECLPIIKDKLISKDIIPWIKKESIKKIIAQHESEIEDHSKFLMTLVVLASWQEKYLL
jgi:asparagine synthase (glutamine-hydrolysing)